MRQYDGWVVLYQPKYTIPGVFDLNRRGLFQEKPPATHRYGARLLVNGVGKVAIEYRYLIEKKMLQNGLVFNFATETGIIPLPDCCTFDQSVLEETINDSEMMREVELIYLEWSQNAVPKDEQGGIDAKMLEVKLSNAYQDGKTSICREIKRRNSSWIEARVPALTCHLLNWSQGELADKCFKSYINEQNGEDQQNLISKIAHFLLICSTKDSNGYFRPDGKEWLNEDEMWDCWTGFAGNEKEAKRVVRAFDSAYRSIIEQDENNLQESQ